MDGLTSLYGCFSLFSLTIFESVLLWNGILLTAGTSVSFEFPLKSFNKLSYFSAGNSNGCKWLINLVMILFPGSYISFDLILESPLVICRIILPSFQLLHSKLLSFTITMLPSINSVLQWDLDCLWTSGIVSLKLRRYSHFQTF